MQIIRRSSFVATPWKNGGGITHEVIRVGAADAFRWRVSVAQIDAPGPFSNFAGYARTMVLLKGAGVRLRFAGGAQRELARIGAMAEFDGALAAHCELLDGPCTDLNVMVSKALDAPRAWVERLPESRALPAHPGTTLMFPISGEVSLGGAGDAQTVDLPQTVEAWDLAVLAPLTQVIVGPVAAAPLAAAPLVFFAALNDNPP